MVGNQGHAKMKKRRNVMEYTTWCRANHMVVLQYVMAAFFLKIWLDFTLALKIICKFANDKCVAENTNAI